MFGLFKKKPSVPGLDVTQILPRIKNSVLLTQLRENGVPEDQLPVTEPLVGDLMVAYAFDLPDTLVSVASRHLTELGIDAQSLRRISMENLRRQVPNIQLQQSGAIFRAVTGENMDACTLLTNGLWKNQAESFSGDLVVSVPDRDTVMFCDAADQDAVDELRTLTKQAYQVGGNHALTETLLAFTGDGWAVYDG